jgi:hypothetical protein
MGKVFDSIDERLADWIARQSMFFVGTAPLADDGHVNVSPKGPIGSLAVLGPRRVAYLDVVGSGTETIAHLRENGGSSSCSAPSRDRPPKIVRLHGQGEVLTPDSDRFDRVIAEAGFEEPAVVLESRRAVIDVEVARIADFVWLRRAADGLRGRASASGSLLSQAHPQFRPRSVRRLPARAQRYEHRQPARRRDLTTPAT